MASCNKALGAVMKAARAWRWVLVLVLACIASPAAAHPAPFSFIELHVEAGDPHGSLTIHDYDVVQTLHLDADANLRDPTLLESIRGELIAQIDARLQLSMDGRRVAPQWGPLEPMPDGQSVMLTFGLDRSMRSQLEIEALLFPYDPSHQTFVNIYEGDRLREQAVLSVDQPKMLYFSGGVQGRAALVWTFLKSGVHHIATGFDHICFLIGLILLGGSLRRLATIVTAFTISHSITLTLATLGLVRLPPAPVEALIALSIIVVGVDNILVLRDQAKGSASVRDIRAPMAGAFGLLHGFGFASVLAETNLPRAALGWSLGAFNIGVEIGQLIIVVVLVGVARLFARAGALRPATMRVGALAGSIAVTAFGAFWLAQRIGWIPAQFGT